MASFTYTAWSDLSFSALMNQLQNVFGQLSFSLKNPESGKIHVWREEEIEIDPTASESISGMGLPISIQWWRGEEDINVSIDEEVGGLVCQVTLVGLSRDEQAEIAKLLILHVTPDKQRFPEDFDVFRLSAQ